MCPDMLTHHLCSAHAILGGTYVEEWPIPAPIREVQGTTGSSVVKTFASCGEVPKDCGFESRSGQKLERRLQPLKFLCFTSNHKVNKLFSFFKSILNC